MASTARAPARDPYGPDPDAGPDEPLARPALKAAWEQLKESIRRDSRSFELRLRAAELLKGLDSYDEGVAQCRAAIRLKPKSALAHLKKGELEAGLGFYADARRSLDRAAALAPVPHTLLQTSHLLEEIGDFGAVMEHLRRAVRSDPRDAATRRALARLELWSGRYAPARVHAEAAVRSEPESAEGLRLLGGALVCLKRFPPALKRLDAALSRDPGDVEAYIWRAEARRLSGDFDGSLEDARRARAIWSTPLGALINEWIIRLSRGEWFSRENDDQPYLQSFIPPPVYDLRDASYERNPKRWLAALNAGLGLMKGNRSLKTTYFWAPQRRKPRLVTHIHFFPRSLPVEVQTRVRFGDYERVLKQFKDMMARSPDEAYLYSHRGEVLLWAGRYREARKSFARARELIDMLLWPKVGLLVCDLFEGKPRRAIDGMERLQGSPSILLPWRVEICRRLGEHKKVLELCAGFDEPLPFRPHVWLNLALSKAALGDRAGMREIFDGLCRHAPEFMADVLRLTGQGARGAGPGAPPPGRGARPPGRPSSDAAVERVLLKALECMRGNRSRWLPTYFADDDAMRVIRFSGVDKSRIPPQLSGYRWLFDEPPR